MSEPKRRGDPPYLRLYYHERDELRRDHPDIWADKVVRADHDLLMEMADRAYPSPAEAPRDVDDGSLDVLASAGLIERLHGYQFRVPLVDRERERRSARAKGASDVAQAGRVSGDDQPTISRQSTDGPSRAVAEQEQEQSRAVAVVARPREPDDDDHLETWYQLTARAPSHGATRYLDDTAKDYGSQRLSRALAVEHQLDPDPGSLISRARDRLWRESHEDEKAAERRRRAEADAERARIETMPIEQRQANLARLREQMVESGLMTPRQAEAYLNGEVDA